MFEQLVSEAASRFNVSPTSVTALLRGLFPLVTNESTGGLTGFLDQFRRAGLGDAISSWLGGKDVRPLTAPQLESALGDATVDRLAVSSGLARAAAAPVLAYLVPKVIGFLTPNGVVPSTAALRSQLAGLLDRPAPAIDRHADAPRAAPPVIAERKGLPAWIPWASAALIALVGFLWLRGPFRHDQPAADRLQPRRQGELLGYRAGRGHAVGDSHRAQHDLRRSKRDRRSPRRPQRPAGAMARASG